MNILNRYFTKIMWIGSVNRPDRSAQMEAQLDKYEIAAERFEAHWKPIDHLGNPNANFGCTSSHRGVLELICHNRWKRTLVLEDDSVFVEDSWQEQFEAMIPDIPEAWDFLFLGASFAEAPKCRVNGSIIRTNGMMTTSSYGISLSMARKMAPHLSGIGPVDSLMQQWQRDNVSLILSPRLMVQGPGMSDLTDRYSINSNSMLDRSHEDALDGVTNPND